MRFSISVRLSPAASPSLPITTVSSSALGGYMVDARLAACGDVTREPPRDIRLPLRDTWLIAVSLPVEDIM
ncbi:hypothetical protein DQ04_06771030 [Trypanosoma grayi]|uniref:hypothetical protein n=1 Tax=Trypanosoma grayi TaxID=71804 RepID=UPI0004F42886|nr:hypothetical protein DQ04_06771030 [Trypanosoma grayi]KEG08631.1 hypothetical protein DQ04_06771030 [Trypanosoma grayi]